MNVTTFIELFWAWTTLIVSAMLFIRPAVLRELKALVVEDRGFGISYGFFSIFLGLSSVLVHNVWELGWRTIVTLIAWGALLKGIYVIAYPEPSKKTNFELRVLTTRIALAVVCVGCVVVLMAVYSR
ncbi:hypothetical protein ACFXJ8_37405 [Nonomuraea sp. NPDC059194]|uniref:hypothetical protein n=1 Tax=Nonomuraea sp. NPDC059194 TaxID=3346764 RepID=UPI0036B4E5EE